MHNTQHPLQPIFEHAQQQAGVYELFHLVATAEVTAMGMEHDLFAGIAGAVASLTHHAERNASTTKAYFR